MSSLLLMRLLARMGVVATGLAVRLSTSQAGQQGTLWRSSCDNVAVASQYGYCKAGLAPNAWTVDMRRWKPANASNARFRGVLSTSRWRWRWC
ncbi:hypothetical protein BD289DRAFT_184419 [Coniella lustricola]|uniref:Secreted protein n=1 Tax=Coniella lustricola TaxID=2025994 RepID=A0A2T3ADB0_9PEZI|nr:hypothetical protein BD289DRAFT_184419 [Coniella lustricola]